ncbi:MAG: AI-2E family transporter [Bacillota bacterium]
MFNLNKNYFKYIFISILIIFLLISLVYIRTSIFPFILGILMAYLFNPFIEYMKKRNFSRNGAILILIIIIFNIIFISGLFLAPILLKELTNLTEYIPEYISEIDAIVSDLNEKYKQIHLPPLIEDAFNEFLNEAENYIINLIHRMTDFLFNSIPFLFSVILSPIITYYILKDLEDFKKSFMKIIPDNNKSLCMKIAGEVNKIFIGFLRGQLWISIFVSVLISIGLFFLKVNFYIILGIIGGISNIIPYFGPIIGAVPAVLISFIDYPLKSLGVIFLYIFIQQLESLLIAPKIMSENVGLHPLLVIFSLLAGTELLGIWGLVFAIPVTAILKRAIKILLNSTSFF